MALVLAFGITWLFGSIMSQTTVLVLATVAVISTATALNNWLDQKFQFLSHASAARHAAFAIAQRENRMENLNGPFSDLLKGWGQSENVVILSGTKGEVSGCGVELESESVVIRVMKILRWVTPERLVRERSSPERQMVAEFLAERGLGVLVIEEGPILTLLVGVGPGTSRRPYTYPQVTQLMELASIIQGAFERAHLSTKAQQAEQLATVGLLGASVAHEIRNPLVSIKTFVQLLPTHYQDQRFRDKFFRLIGDEVARIDQLTEQLLDLASPRAYAAELIELHPLLTAGLDLVAAKAAHRQVDLITDFKAKPDRAFTDASAAKQVMLNLCFNAIQAVENHKTDQRWVKIATRNTGRGIEMAIADSGPGIDPEIRPRLFQPFQTTKSSGFGLGLAICSDILANLQASITVDPHEPGHGATFRVTFPCQPSSS
jgi:signal transduction histidine kinase